MAGPGIAGLLYSYFGYFYAFLSFVVLVSISAMLCYVYIPKSINNSPAQYDELITGEEPNEQKQASYKKFFSYRRIIFAILTSAYCCVFF
jgi:hypothetical protein